VYAWIDGYDESRDRDGPRRVDASTGADRCVGRSDGGSQLLTAPTTARHRYQQLSRSGRSPTQSERHGRNAISEQDHGAVTDIDDIISIITKLPRWRRRWAAFAVALRDRTMHLNHANVGFRCHLQQSMHRAGMATYDALHRPNYSHPL